MKKGGWENREEVKMERYREKRTGRRWEDGEEDGSER